MSDIEKEQLMTSIDRLNKLFALGKLVVGMCAACVTAAGGIAVWVYSTNTGRANDHAAIVEIAKDRREAIIEWTEWRRKKDEADTRIITLLENQQRIIDRIEARGR